MTFQIFESVGANAVNRPEDVKMVQELLNKVPPADGGPMPPGLKVDGLAWDKTIGAIKKFQKEHLKFQWPDGRVDPSGKTFHALLAFDKLPVAPKGSKPPVDPKAQAEADKPQALMWAMAAQAMLAFYDVLKLAPMQDPLGDKALIETALNTHFHLNKQPALQSQFLSAIKYNYSNVRNALLSSATFFRSRTKAEAASDGAIDKKTGAPYPAYAFFNKSVNFTETYLLFGPLCRAAMVLHEPVHYVDCLAGPNNDHYEHGAAYDQLTPQQAIHNPSSYVAFAQHVFYKKDVRYGAGRPNE